MRRVRTVGGKHGHAGRVTLPGGSAGRLAPPDGGGTPSLPGGFCEMRWWRAGGEAPPRWRLSQLVFARGALTGRTGVSPVPWAIRVRLLQRTRRPLSQLVRRRQDGGFLYGRDGRDEGKLKDRLFIRGTFSLNYAIMCHG